VKHVLVSRTDRLGDSILTLPLCGLLRARFPGIRITYLGRRYTAPVVARSPHVDAVLAWDDLAATGNPAQALRDAAATVPFDLALHVFPDRDIARAVASARIPRRIGTSRRWYHWLWANERVPLHRKGSRLHESQLNVQLIVPLLGLKALPSRDELRPLVTLVPPAPSERIRALLTAARDGGRFVLVVHPMSGGSNANWPLEHVRSLIDQLDPSRFRVVLSGSASERATLDAWMSSLPAHVVDGTSGTMDELMALLAGSDGVLAPSTGPLHLAAALGKRTAGLFRHPATSWDISRWHPLGPRATVLTPPEPCADCARLGPRCTCVRLLTPAVVAGHVEAWAAGRDADVGPG
jgi:ADP-heptose:LPS heptosyltransferase